MGCLFYLHGFAQKTTYKHQIDFTNDNDIYLLKYRDAYYTNGFLLNYSKISNDTGKKIIHKFSLGQNMYNVLDRRATWRLEKPFDRPYCGYLFVRYTQDKFLTNEQLLSYNVELGATGDFSLARQLQNWYHLLLGLFDYPYWEYQIPNSIGINAQINYAATLWPNKVENAHFKIVPYTNAQLGNYFINATAGAYFVAGFFEQSNNSALFHANINNTTLKKRYKKEMFVSATPQIILQGYNATLQGNLWGKTNAATIYAAPVPVMFQTKLSAVYATSKITLSIAYVYQTKEAKSQLENHEYISLQGAIRF